MKEGRYQFLYNFTWFDHEIYVYSTFIYIKINYSLSIPRLWELFYFFLKKTTLDEKKFYLILIKTSPFGYKEEFVNTNKISFLWFEQIIFKNSKFLTGIKFNFEFEYKFEQNEDLRELCKEMSEKGFNLSHELKKNFN